MIPDPEGDGLDEIYYFVATETSLRFDDLTYPQLRILTEQNHKAQQT